MAKSVFTCFQILKPTTNEWAQYPARMEALDIALFNAYT